MIKHHGQRAFAESSRVIGRSQRAVMKDASLFLIGEMAASFVKKALSIAERSVRQQLHSRLCFDRARTHLVSGDRGEIDISDFGCQLLKILFPSCHRLSARSYEVINEDHCIVGTKPGTSEVASTDEERIKLLFVEFIRETELVEHGAAALTFAR